MAKNTKSGGGGATAPPGDAAATPTGFKRGPARNFHCRVAVF